MKIICVETPVQNESTINPQVIDGKILHWKARSVKTPKTLQEFITSIKECYDNIEYFLIYDIIPCDRYFCDQGCEPGYGCKTEYKEDNHAIFIRYTVIQKETENLNQTKLQF